MTEQEGHVHEAILARVHEADAQVAQAQPTAHARELVVVPVVRQHERLRGHHHRGLDGHVHVLGRAIPLARYQGQ